ncbi:hypothetical protein [Rhizobium leguminosarum]|uniref:hypothetical protein n=1 Tax=Rhizobium leguminosarum TaxID=384 RepID=UPI001C918EC1|nr:hypothetical protein [Rhizobium leguminosarum]MBY2921458.1 TonB C-terminal domain-containing protein [Rhizobium leguminosarum]MBY2985315.1 TonB C-terminal domain-containing protein [Rhizobium leguminosarum]MBY3021296.1 TonB C-terminal domain-containing protein [Rhizobium leguminosarum]
MIVFPAAFASVAAVLVKREYRCRFPTQGHDMKAIISAACAAVFLLSGCATTTTTQNGAKFTTDKHGRVSDVTFEKSSGSDIMDSSLKRSAISRFYEIVPKPLPNRTYLQPLVLVTPTTLEDYMHQDPKTAD